MKHLLIKTIAGTGLLLLTVAANAQYQPRPIQYQEEREARHDRIFDRARADLDRAGGFAMPYTGDHERLDEALARVDDCQRAVATGEDDGRTFGVTIAAIQRVVDRNRMPDENRNMLIDDVVALRHLQERMEG